MKITQKITRTTQVALGAAGVLAALGAAAPQTARAATLDAPLTRTLAAHPKTGLTSVIARTRGPLTPAQQGTLTALGADVTRHLSIIGSLELRIPVKNLSKLAALPFVTRLSYDGQIKKCDEFTVAGSGAGTAYRQYGLTGQGVTVAVIDSGINLSADLSGSYKTPTTPGWWPASASSPEPPAPTMTVGTAPMSPASLPATDVCPPARTAAAPSTARPAPQASSTSAYWTATGKARSVRSSAASSGRSPTRPSTTSASSTSRWVIPVGESFATDPLCQAVEAAYRAGIVVVCAAGNEGRAGLANDPTQSNEGWGTAYGSINSPGNDPYVITVGAMKQMDAVRNDDRIATYSSRGPSRLDLVLKPDIVAPGNLVISLANPGATLYTAHGSTNIIPWTAYQYNEDQHLRLPRLFPPVRDVHGGAGRLGSGGAAAAEVPDDFPRTR